MNICGGEKYILRNDTIALPVEISGLPDTFNAEGEVLLGKSSYHVTLVALGKIKEKYDIKAEDFIEKATKLFCEYIKTNDVSLVNYRDEFYFVQDERGRKTIVVMCDISKLNGYFDIFNKEFGIRYKKRGLF